MVFPTGVGMNRHLRSLGGGFKGVPHRRGDEPTTPEAEREVLRVPHRRGDEPEAESGLPPKIECSPQAWG